jgi:hypothetical protein
MDARAGPARRRPRPSRRRRGSSARRLGSREHASSPGPSTARRRRRARTGRRSAWPRIASHDERRELVDRGANAVPRAVGVGDLSPADEVVVGLDPDEDPRPPAGVAGERLDPCHPHRPGTLDPDADLAVREQRHRQSRSDFGGRNPASVLKRASIARPSKPLRSGSPKAGSPRQPGAATENQARIRFAGGIGISDRDGFLTSLVANPASAARRRRR